MQLLLERDRLEDILLTLAPSTPCTTPTTAGKRKRKQSYSDNTNTSSTSNNEPVSSNKRHVKNAISTTTATVMDSSHKQQGSKNNNTTTNNNSKQIGSRCCFKYPNEDGPYYWGTIIGSRGTSNYKRKTKIFSVCFFFSIFIGIFARKKNISIF